MLERANPNPTHQLPVVLYADLDLGPGLLSYKKKLERLQNYVNYVLVTLNVENLETMN